MIEIAACAVICGADAWGEVEGFGQSERSFFETVRRAVRTAVVEGLRPVVLAQGCRPNLQDRFQAAVISELFRSRHAVVDLLDQRLDQ